MEWLKISPQNADKNIDKVLIDIQDSNRLVRYDATNLKVKNSEHLSIWVNNTGNQFGIGSQLPQDFKLALKFYNFATGISSEQSPVDIHKDDGDYVLEITSWKDPPKTTDTTGVISSLLPI